MYVILEEMQRHNVIHAEMYWSIQAVMFIVHAGHRMIRPYESVALCRVEIFVDVFRFVKTCHQPQQLLDLVNSRSDTHLNSFYAAKNAEF